MGIELLESTTEFRRNATNTTDFCTGSVAVGGDGGEGEAMVEPVHRVVEVLEGRLAEFFMMASPMVENTNDAASKDA